MQNRQDHPEQTPFLRLLLPLIGGILIQYFSPTQAVFLFVGFFSSVVLFIYCHFFSFKECYRMPWLAGAAIQIAIFSFGRILISIHQDILVENTRCFASGKSNTLLLRILNEPSPKQHSLKCMAEISWLINRNSCFTQKEKVFIYLHDKSNPHRIRAGSLIIMRKQLTPIENTASSDFDYKKYCRLRHIYAQVFLKENDFDLIDVDTEVSFFSYLDSLRRKLLITIRKQIPDKSENGFLEALMVGFTDDLDPALMKSYADTGVIHIIAISGMHLALICHMLQFSVGGLGKKRGRWVRFLLLVSILWGYSLLSGASPSVIRAAAMFSMILFARCISREASRFNTLAASAFLLLCFDPFWFWDTGFQLSYAAVLSLLLFSKPLRALISLQNKMLQSLWDAISVSLAAQILITPVSLFYFHRFPTYFLLANLLAVPVSSGILLGGILLCFISVIHPVGHWLGWILAWLIRFLNSFVQRVSGLPGAVISELIVTLPQLVLLYVLIFCLYRLWTSRDKSWFLAALGTISLMQFTRWIPT